jgi:hypothetical protein
MWRCDADLMFSKDAREKAKQEGTKDLTIRELSEMWRNLPEDEKEVRCRRCSVPRASVIHCAFDERVVECVPLVGRRIV